LTGFRPGNVLSLSKDGARSRRASPWALPGPCGTFPSSSSKEPTSTAFNRFFLIYVALFTLSIFALIFGLANADVKSIRQRFRARTPVRGIGGYILFVAVGIGGLWVTQSLSFVVTGQVPQFIIDVAHPTSVVFVLDLSLVVPFLVLGAIWLRKRRPWGYVLAAILNVKGIVYMLALAAASVSAKKAGFPKASAQLPLWGLLGLGFLAATLFLLGERAISTGAGGFCDISKEGT
jgi:hypothetical protein